MLFLWLWVVSFGFWVGLPFLLEKFSISKALLTHNPKPITQNLKPRKRIINLEKETVLRDCSLDLSAICGEMYLGKENNV